MKPVICSSCGREIPLARLEAVPGTNRCTDCASKTDVQKTVGVMCWDHKTAPYIEVGTKLAKETAGKKHRYGPHFRLGSKVSSSIAGAPRRTSVEGLETKLMFPSRCHPSRPKIGPTGLCLECSLELQKVRLR